MQAFDFVFAGRVMSTVALLVGFVTAWRYVLVSTIIEEFRQTVFQLRRELFLMIAAGKIKQNDAIYVRLRSIMNGSLRYAEGITFFRMFVFTCMSNGQPTEERLRFDAVSDAEVAQELREIYLRLGISIVRLIYGTSVFLPVFYTILQLISLLPNSRQLEKLAQRPEVALIERDVADCLENEQLAAA
jgi:hypothetical protein